jgi:hypothetical protein
MRRTYYDTSSVVWTAQLVIGLDIFMPGIKSNISLTLQHMKLALNSNSQGSFHRTGAKLNLSQQCLWNWFWDLQQMCCAAVTTWEISTMHVIMPVTRAKCTSQQSLWASSAGLPKEPTSSCPGRQLGAISPSLHTCHTFLILNGLLLVIVTLARKAHGAFIQSNIF